MARPLIDYITYGKMHVLHVNACVTQARTTMDLFRLLVTEQSNDVLKQLVIVYEIYPHINTVPTCIDIL